MGKVGNIKMLKGGSKDLQSFVGSAVVDKNYITFISKKSDVNLTVNTKDLIELLRMAGLIDEVK